MNYSFTCNVQGCFATAKINGKCDPHARSEVKAITGEKALFKPALAALLEKAARSTKKSTKLSADAWREKRLQRFLKYLQEGHEVRSSPNSIYIFKHKNSKIFIEPDIFEEVKNKGLLESLGKTERGPRAERYRWKPENL